MRLLKYLKEKWQFTYKPEYSINPVEVFANPSKSDYRDVLEPDSKFFRFVADPKKKVFYIFSVDALHSDVIAKLTGNKKSYGIMYGGIGRYMGGKAKMTLGAAWSMHTPKEKEEMKKIDWKWLGRWIANWQEVVDDIRGSNPLWRYQE